MAHSIITNAMVWQAHRPWAGNQRVRLQSFYAGTGGARAAVQPRLTLAMVQATCWKWSRIVRTRYGTPRQRGSRHVRDRCLLCLCNLGGYGSRIHGFSPHTTPGESHWYDAHAAVTACAAPPAACPAAPPGGRAGAPAAARRHRRPTRSGALVPPWPTLNTIPAPRRSPPRGGYSRPAAPVHQTPPHTPPGGRYRLARPRR